MKIFKSILNFLLFDYWKLKGTVIGIALTLFLFVFILPNSIHNASIDRQLLRVEIYMDGGPGIYTLIPESPGLFGNPFEHNWVLYGFKWLGILLGVIAGFIGFEFSILGIVNELDRLSKWSHK